MDDFVILDSGFAVLTGLVDTNPEGTNAKYVALFTDTHIRMYPNPISEDELGTAHNYELDIDLKTCGGISLNQTSVSIGTKINPLVLYFPSTEQRNIWFSALLLVNKGKIKTKADIIKIDILAKKDFEQIKTKLGRVSLLREVDAEAQKQSNSTGTAKEQVPEAETTLPQQTLSSNFVYPNPLTHETSGLSQKNMQEWAFMTWINYYLEENDMEPIDDLKCMYQISNVAKLLQATRLPMPTETIKGDSMFETMQSTSAVVSTLATKYSLELSIDTTAYVNKSKKEMMELVWYLIYCKELATISYGGLKSKNALLAWCKNKLVFYDELEVENFGEGWSNGVLLCTLMECLKPNSFDLQYNIMPHKKLDNLHAAFEFGTKAFRIPKLMIPQDFDSSEGDETTMIIYLAMLYHATK